MSGQIPPFPQQMNTRPQTEGMARSPTNNIKPFQAVLQQPSFLVPITPYICSPLGVFAFSPQMMGPMGPQAMHTMGPGMIPQGMMAISTPMMLPGGAQPIQPPEGMSFNQLAPMIQQTAPILSPPPGSREGTGLRSQKAPPLEPAVSPSIDSSRTAKQSLMGQKPQAPEPITPPNTATRLSDPSGELIPAKTAVSPPQLPSQVPGVVKPLSQVHAEAEAEARAKARAAQSKGEFEAAQKAVQQMIPADENSDGEPLKRPPGRPPTKKIKVLESVVGLDPEPVMVVGGYQCAFCRKTMKSRQHCRRHMRTHFGSKSHPCLRCEKLFHRKDTRDRHQAGCKKRLRD